MRDRDARTLADLLGRRGQFGHREHLELAWAYLAAYPVNEAEQTMAEAIRDLAQRHEQPAKYHETMTRAWVRLVAAHRHHSDATRFEDFMAANPALLDRRLLEGYYSPAALWSDRARAGWLTPDLRALPSPA